MIEFRHYRDEDYEALCAFLIALNRDDRRHINWNWARLEWMIEHPEFDKSLRASIGLWAEGGKLVGAAIYDMYFGEAFCGVLPEHTALYPEVLRYAYEALKDEAGLALAICGESAEEIAAARSLGFVLTEQAETIMSRALDAPLSAPLPEGFSFAELDPRAEPRAFQWLMWQGFDHGADLSEFEADFEKTMRLGLKPRPHFDPHLSAAAVDESGEKVSYCCVWYDARTDYAYVEPVCTIPARRGRGVTRAVVFEALDRARTLGAKKAYVISDLAFYEKLGFEKELRFSFYRKEQ